MAKEMIVSSNNHETKIAILEDDQVAELYFEREKNYTLAGSIYKGRVTRVLPGMQSAFVDIGLERDAFLYVSDFLEDTEEYDRIAATVEEKVTDMEAKAASAGSTEVQVDRVSVVKPEAPEAEGEAAGESVADTGADRPASGLDSQQAGDRRSRFSRRSRRRRGRQKDFPDSKYANRQPPAETPPQPAAPPAAAVSAAPTTMAVPEPPIIPILLPGESLAKYRDRGPSQPAVTSHGETESVRRDDVTNPERASNESFVTEGSHAASGETATIASESRLEEPRRIPLTWETMSGFLSKPIVPEPEEAASATASSTLEIAKNATAPTAASDAEIAKTQSIAPASESFSEAEMTNEGALENVVSADYIEELSEDVEDSAEASFDESTGEGEAEELSVAEGGEPEAVSPEDGSAPSGGQSTADKPQRASVRDRHRNPRYMRKGRWNARRGDRSGEPRPDAVKGPSKPRERETTPQPLIADLLKEGQEIIVQIAKEPLGKKGARITSHVALPGRYLVYMPTVDHVGVSRKISSDEERQRLKRIILEHSKGIQGGFIVRTAGAGHSEEDLRQDIQYLSSLWSEMKVAAEKTSAPVLLHHDLNLVLRILRDQFSTDFSAVWVDNEQEYERILGLVNKFQPALVNRVKLYSKDLPLFEEMGIQEEINKALKPKVWLKSGGYIVINQTEALVAIDINTGKFVGKSNRLEDTIVKTNTEAIKEIVRQIRLRDLGGIIVIDFIDMEERKNRQKVMVAMEEALRADRSPSKILAFNEFGLVAITRKRVRQSLERSLCQPCAYCGGSGLVKSVATVSYEILSEAKKIAHEFEKKQITLRVNPEVGRALKTRENTILQEIEELAQKPVIIRNDPSLHIEHFDFN